MKLPKYSGLLVALALSSAAHAQWGSSQLARIYAADLGTSDDFGTSIDVSGTSMIVGAPKQDGSPSALDVGAAYVFVQSGANWLQEQKLITSTATAGDRCGAAVALDGDTAVVGAPLDEQGTGVGAGAVFVFVRNAGVWTEQARLVANDFSNGDQFGNSVAIHGDTLVVGAPFDLTGNVLWHGSAYVFVRAGGTWSQQAKLIAGDFAHMDQFGTSVAISGDTIVAGAPFDNTVALNDHGSAYVFVRSGTTWSQQQKLVASDAANNDNCGTAVTIDGDTLAVGAPNDDAVISNDGSAYVWVRTAATWTQQAKLSDLGTIGQDDNFGTSLDLEGERLVAGLPANEQGGSNAGSVELFTRTGTTWTGQTEIIGGDTDQSDSLGTSVAISGDLVVAGARMAETPPSNAPTGEAYVFELTAPALVVAYCTAKTNSLGCAPQLGWSGSPSASNPIPFQVTCSGVINNKSGLLFYGSAPLATPFQGGYLCVASPTHRTLLQNSQGNGFPANDCSGNYALNMNALIQSGVDVNLAAELTFIASTGCAIPRARAPRA